MAAQHDSDHMNEDPRGEAHQQSGVQEDLSVADKLAHLQGGLGPQMTAYLAGLSGVGELAPIASGRMPSRTVRRRLDAAYSVAIAIGRVYDTSTAASWLFGTNARLDDEAPVEVIRQAEDADVLVTVVDAAKAFAYR
jgi:hypothetical protein